jgi:hypothetical protein
MHDATHLQPSSAPTDHHQVEVFTPESRPGSGSYVPRFPRVPEPRLRVLAAFVHERFIMWNSQNISSAPNVNRSEIRFHDVTVSEVATWERPGSGGVSPRHRCDCHVFSTPGCKGGNIPNLYLLVMDVVSTLVANNWTVLTKVFRMRSPTRMTSCHISTTIPTNQFPGATH